MAGDTSIDMMLNVVPGTLTGIFALNAGLSSINQQFQNMTKSVDNHFGIFEAGIVAASALAIQFGKNAADSFGQYEQGMKIVQAVSGQSKAAIDELGQAANQFSVQYRVDIDQLTEGLQTLGRAGLKSAQEQTEVLESGLNTAKLEGRDLNGVLEELIQNTTLLGGNLKSSNFGEQSEYVNDLLVATSMTAPINTHDISETLKYSGGMLAAAGGTITDENGRDNKEGKELIEDYMGTVAAFAQKGVTGSIAGTALRAFFNKPATQDTSVTEALAKIHLKPEYLWEEDEQTMKPVSEQIGLIQSQMDKLGVSQMDRLQIWSKIVGGKMGQQMIKLDSSDIKDITKDIHAANSAENLATQSMQTYQAAMKQTSEAGQQAFRAFGEHVARFLTPVAKILTPILQALANPVISTTAFAGFLMLLGRAWQSLKKIFSGVRAEVGILKAEMKSLIMNQPARRQVMAGQLHGGGVVAGYAEQQVINKMRADYYSMNQSARSTSTVIKETGVQSEVSSSSVLRVVNNIRDIIVAVQNKIKETVLEINSSLNNGIKVFQTSLIKGVTQTSTQMRTQYNEAITQTSASFNTRMNQNIRTSATRMKSEFQAALNSLTYTPKIKPTGMAVANSSIQQKTDLKSGSYFFLQDKNRQSKNLESDFNKKLKSLEQRRANVMLSRDVTGSISAQEKKKDRLEKQYLGLTKQIQSIPKKIETQSKIIDEANTKLKTHYEKLSAQQKADLYTQKENAEKEKASLIEKQRLLKEERMYKGEEISIHKNIIKELKVLLAQINNERLNRLAGKGTTVKGAYGVMPGTNPHMIGGTQVPPDYTPRANYLARGYGHYTTNGAMPMAPGNFNWNNVPKEYHPNSGVGGTTTPFILNKSADRGNALLGKLRQEEIAMTRQMAQALGISDKELIRFYEELIQANIALNNLGKTTISNGKAVTGNSLDTLNKNFQKNVVGDTLYKTKGNMVPIYGAPANSTGHLTDRDRRGLKALFGDTSGPGGKEFKKDLEDSRRQIKNRLDTNARDISQLSRYNLPQGVYSANQVNTNLLNQSSTSFGQAGGAFSTVSRDLIDKTVRMQETTLKQKMSGRLSGIWNASGAKNITKGLTNSFRGLGGAVGKVTSFMGGPFFAGMMAIDVAMQVWNHYQQEYTKKIEEATQALDEAISKQEEAVEIFYNGRHEEGQAEITGWSEEHEDATAEEKEDALLGAYSDIYDNSTKGLGSLDANTRQLAIATEQVKQAGDKIERTYLSGDFFSGTGTYQHMIDDFKGTSYKGKGNDLLSGALTGLIAGGSAAFYQAYDVFGGSLFGKESAVDKFGNHRKFTGESYFDGDEILLGDWQKDENYPWLQEFGPLLSADIWKTGSTKDGLQVALGKEGYSKLNDQLSSQGGWDNSAFTRHGYNIANTFGSAKDQNRLQLAFKNYGPDLAKLAKQTRRFEKATGTTAMKAFNVQRQKSPNIKKALKNLSVQDPKLVSYIKSLAIKTGMTEQQVLMAAQLQQLQEMQSIAKDQVTPRMESLVSSAYQTVAYGGQTLGEVQGSGGGAVSAAQNAAAIAALLNAEMETKIDEQNYQDYMNNLDDPSQRKYKTKEEFAAAVNKARTDGKTDYLDQYAEKKFKTYAATNFMMWNPELSEADAAKRADEWYKGLGDNVKSSAIYDTLRKGARGALTNSILAAYDQTLDEQEGNGSGGGGGSGSGNKNNDSGTRKERVDLVLCNRKTIPKLNVNLFKKPPSFTILNKNFKLRDVRINSEDKPKAIMAAIKNSFIDIQKRTDPKIIQDEDAVYDPAAATDGTNVPSGSAKTNTS